MRVHLDGTDPDAVMLSVSNSGRIAAELLPHIFDPFRGREERAGRSGGLGIGLYIVQQILAAHGGTVSVTSGDNEQTEFRVRLPRRMDPEI